MEQVSQQSAVALGQSVTDTSVSAIQLILFPAGFVTLNLQMLARFPSSQAGKIAKPSFQLQKMLSYGCATSETGCTSQTFLEAEDCLLACKC